MAAETRRQTCTDHCCGCGQHFHGLTAFDAHRVDGICREAGEVLYGAGKRQGQPILQVWTDEGCCDKEAGCWSEGKRLRYAEGVSIWQIAVTTEQRERLQRAWSNESDAQIGLALS